ERNAELDRQLAEVTRHWTEAADIWPKPVQRPRPPIIVGGRAHPGTIRAAIAYADEYNTPFPSVDDARERRRIVDEAARSAGREPLRFSIMTSCVVGRDEADVRDRLARFRERTRSDGPAIAGTLEQVAEQLDRYEGAGVERFMLQHMVHEDVEMVQLLGELA